MKRKVKRYSGEDNESQVKDEPFESGFTPTEDLNPKSTKQSFGDAFKAARSAGDSTFTYNGKSYTTKLASDSKPAPKTESKPEPKPASKTESKPTSSSEDKENPDMVKKAYAEAARMNAENAAKSKAKPKEDKEDPIAAAKAMREQISGKKDSEAPKLTAEPKSAGKKFREFFGSKYKSGGSVRSSASNRGDGIATKGHTRGKIY